MSLLLLFYMEHSCKTTNFSSVFRNRRFFFDFQLSDGFDEVRGLVWLDGMMIWMTPPLDIEDRASPLNLPPDNSIHLLIISGTMDISLNGFLRLPLA
jgi:hypothetical protein